MDNKLIEKVLNDGHKIAEEIRKAKTLDDLEDLDSQIDFYTSYVDNNFGEHDDEQYPDEKNSELTYILSDAMEDKEVYLMTQKNGSKQWDDILLIDFEKMLD